jgi:glycosyltransferase involved in cell wall biosynthesis
MRKPLVSIVIAAYNTRREHLTMAIGSALSQTWGEVEVIVSDDSPDHGLRELVSRFAGQRVRYRHNPVRLGAGRNHWVSFREATGEYITVLNHDDWLAPTLVERLTAALEENPECALAFCDQWVMDADGKTLSDETARMSERYKRSCLPQGVHRPFFHLLGSQTIPMAVGTVFRRRLLPEVLPDSAGPAYDLWLAYFLCREGLGAYYVPDRLSSWRSHAANLTSQGGLDWSYGSAECWRAIATDDRLASIRRLARYRAALAFRSCALDSWLEGRRGQCFVCGCESVRFLPTWKGLAACVLPAIPGWMASRLTSRSRGRLHWPDGTPVAASDPPPRPGGQPHRQEEPDEGRRGL